MKAIHSVSAGQRFGRLLVVEPTVVRKQGRPQRRAARCVCDCGTEVIVLLQGLCKPDGTRSCGCMKRKGTMSERFAETRATPERLNNLTHGLSGHPSYFRWYNMIDRCENPYHPAYRNYGGRGIAVAAEWRDVATFLTYLDEVLGPCPDGCSLDRVDNDGPYAPGNVRWATDSQQVRNRRRRP